MNNMILCDNCKRSIAIGGLMIQSFRAGEYEISFFQCPHCGTKYQINTTDNEQRELLRQQRVQRDKIRAGRAKNFKMKTLRRYAKAAEKAKRQAEQRAGDLNQIGAALLEGKPLDAIMREREETNCEKTNDRSNSTEISHSGQRDQAATGDAAATGERQ
ncbi:MAG: hypothetical protein Q4P20_06570 [Eubacteriales bacterium]|nr:hypothetical protein [Eubacteriales bacterium]